MKFISKFSNYRVVLRPGTPGNRATGTQPVPGLYVKFESGEAEVKNEEHIKMMLEHPAFTNGDFVTEVDTAGIDPYLATRKEIEPLHNITNIEYGHVGKAENPKPVSKMSADQMANLKKIAADLAVNMLKDMLPTAVENEIKRRDQETIVPDSVENIPVKPKNEKILVPEPIEDDTVVEDADSSDSDLPPLEIKESIGGVEVGGEDLIPEPREKPTVAGKKPAVKTKTTAK